MRGKLELLRIARDKGDKAAVAILEGRDDRPMCKCGVRGAANLHVHPGWTERQPRYSR